MLKNNKKLVYSKVVKPRFGAKRVSSRIYKDETLVRSIQIYRFWFMFLRLALDCEDNGIKIYDYKNHKNISVKVNKKFYKEWDLDRVKTDNFNNWWQDHKHLFLETKTEIVNNVIDDDNYIHVRIDKRSKKIDVIRDIRKLIEPNKSFTARFNPKQQHKAVATHMKYNVFVWRNMGKKREEIMCLLSKYRIYGVRIPSDESSVRRVLRNSERLIIETAKGEF